MKKYYFITILIFSVIFSGIIQPVYSETEERLEVLSSQQERIEEMRSTVNLLFVLAEESGKRETVESALNELLSKIDSIQERIRSRIVEIEKKSVVESEPESEPTPEPEPELEPEPEATMGEKNAARKAKDYLAFSSFSRDGLIAQLEHEGFTRQQAEYGVNQCGADWNEQAALKAQQYLDFSSFSRDGLIAQLEHEGFTRQQAEYGVQAVGY